jgi:DNA-binding transcriptional ArsR family regulator
MFEDLFGSRTGEGVILYLSVLSEGHSRGIASALGLSPSQVDRTMKRLENGGIVVGKFVGRTRLYELNPTLPFKKELIALADRILMSMPDRDREKFIERRRPRRTGKKLR